MPNKLASNEYIPAEDTFFLADGIEAESGTSALDVGTGSGYLAKLLTKKFSFVAGTDINFQALSNQTYKIDNLVCCHGASAFNVQFDLIICNLPYLATDEILDIATDGGKDGLEITTKIIDTIPSQLKPGGKFLFITSSLSNYQKLIQYCQGLKLHVRVVSKKKLFFEELILVEAKKSTNLQF